ncbi:MAG TPA: hypothetical protein VGI39_25695 [Polyangiaceae bacterium]|jgi:hypothetical protein
MRALFLSAVCALGIVACGGATTSAGGGSSTVSGTVAGGQNVATTDAIGVVTTQTQTVGSTTITIAGAGVAITNKANVCQIVQSQKTPNSTAVLSLSVSKPGNSVPLGTYAIGTDAQSNTYVGAEYGVSDASCKTVTDESATEGTITFTTITSTTVQGTFDVTMDNGDHLTGSFDAPVCAIPFASKTGNPPCEG